VPGRSRAVPDERQGGFHHTAYHGPVLRMRDPSADHPATAPARLYLCPGCAVHRHHFTAGSPGHSEICSEGYNSGDEQVIIQHAIFADQAGT